jgi:hypothetical protein
MRVKSYLLNLGWLEVYLQLRLGRAEACPMRRYFPAPRLRSDRVRSRILHNLGDHLFPGRST